MFCNKAFQSYLKWIVRKYVKDETYDVNRYSSLIKTYSMLRYTPQKLIVMNDNRVGDGENIRKEYLASYYGRNYTESDIKEVVPEDISTLEFLVGFAARTYRELFWGSKFEECYSPHGLVWMMLDNIGVTKLMDGDYSEEEITHEAIKAMVRVYAYDIDAHGNGGIFHIKGDRWDMRKGDYWMQMQWWAAEVYDELYAIEEGSRRMCLISS